MKKNSILLLVLFNHLFCCTPQEQKCQESVSATLTEVEDSESYVSIGWVGPYDSEIKEQLIVLLGKSNIDVYFEGSAVYGVFVEENDKERAIALIKESKLQVSFPEE